MHAAGQLALLHLYVGQSDEPWPVHSNCYAVGQLALLCLPLSILAIPWPACSDVCAIGRLALFLLLLCRTRGTVEQAAQHQYIPHENNWLPDA